MVLNDGTTYTDIKGCKIVWVADGLNDEQIEDALADLPKADLHGAAEIMTEFK